MCHFQFIENKQMKTIRVIQKSIKEQLRSFWLLLLSISMGPFFIFIYYLITEASKPNYRIEIVNQDRGIPIADTQVNYGEQLIEYMNEIENDSVMFPITIVKSESVQASKEHIMHKKSDALIVIHEQFSKDLLELKEDDLNFKIQFLFMGDLTNTDYLISAVWANEMVQRFTYSKLERELLVGIDEVAIGATASINEFDMLVPGILIICLIMLMFTASIAFVSEIENKTIMRLKLSKLRTIEFLTAITFVQLLLGVIALLLALLTAVVLGFSFQGSLLTMIFIACLTSLSIISFSLIIAAFTKSAGEVLVVGNFPMFLFMFFSGAAFPIEGTPLFSIADYPISFQGLMSPTHAISAMHKILVMDMNFNDIIPEVISIIVLTMIYFVIGAIVFKKRHLRLA